LRPRDGLIAVACLLAATAASLSGVARADEAGDAGRFVIGLRTGYGVPFGKFANVRTIDIVRDADVHAIGDDAHGVIPLWLDVGYRIHPNLLIGAYGMYGIVLPKTAPANNPLRGGCPEGFDCAGSGVRFGVRAEYSFVPEGPIEPWVGLGFGYEWITARLEGRFAGFDFESDTSHSGWDLLQLQGGTDFALGDLFSLGPFLLLSGMKYSDCAAELSGQEQACQLDETAWHGWFAFGLRGVAEL
jgi:opacity protein-like surface antigen